MSFSLGTFARQGTAAFPALVLGERVVPLERLEGLLGRLGVRLAGSESVLGILSSWDSNFAALRTIAGALAAGDSGLENIDVRELEVRAPIDTPRQIFCTIANYRSHIVDTVRDPAIAPRLGEVDTAECLQRAAKVIEERLRTPPYICFKLPTTVIGSSYVAGYTLVNDLTVRDWVARPDLPRTPAGCGIRYKRFLKPGDVMEGTAPGFGALRTTCVAERAAT